MLELHAWPVPQCFVPLKPYLPEGKAAALLSVPQDNIYEYTWGHTTMQVGFKRSVDPHLLMNPGKIAGLDDLPGGMSGAALEAAQRPASGWAY